MNTKIYGAICAIVVVFIVAASSMGSEYEKNAQLRSQLRDQSDALEVVCAKQLHETEVYGSRTEYHIVTGACKQGLDDIQAKIRSTQ